jgi:hypothetical protein
MIRHTIPLLALAFLLASPALPQASRAKPRSIEHAKSLEGDWGFRADPTVGEKCVLSGDMRIRKDKGGAYACTFTAKLSCTASAPPRTIDTEQSCTASLKGDQVTVRSKLGRILAVDGRAMIRPSDGTYYPDSFDLVLNASGDEMLGKSYDVNSAEQVKFQRKQELIS